MKKTGLIILAAALLTGCAGKNSNGSKPLDVKLMEGADTDSSAVDIFRYDGEKTTSAWLFDDRSSLIDAVNSAAVYPAPEGITLGELPAPYYGLMCGTGEGNVGGTWADGVWVTVTGEVYLTDLDLPALVSEIEIDGEYGQVGLNTPGACYFAREGGEWHTEFLGKAAELSPRGVELSVSSFENGVISAVMTNVSGEEICVGEYFSLQVQLNGEWYNIPTESELWFKDLGYIIPADESYTFSYHTAPYGALPAGTYRVVAEGAAAEIIIE